jgi:hypothetical protein
VVTGLLATAGLIAIPGSGRRRTCRACR